MNPPRVHAGVPFWSILALATGLRSKSCLLSTVSGVSPSIGGHPGFARPPPSGALCWQRCSQGTATSRDECTWQCPSKSPIRWTGGFAVCFSCLCISMVSLPVAHSHCLPCPCPTCLCPSACRIINTAGAELIATSFLVSNPTVWSLSCFHTLCFSPLYQSHIACVYIIRRVRTTAYLLESLPQHVKMGIYKHT